MYILEHMISLLVPTDDHIELMDQTRHADKQEVAAAGAAAAAAAASTSSSGRRGAAAAAAAAAAARSEKYAEYR